MDTTPGGATVLQRENESLRAEVASLQARVLALTSEAGTLRQSEATFRHLHGARIDGFARVAMDGRIEEVNELFCTMLGYSQEELLRLTYRDITPEKWHAAEEEIIENQVRRGGRSERYEKEYRRKDGTIFPVELQTYLIAGTADEPPMGMAAVVRDISDRRRGEQALRESEEKFKTAFLTSVDACYIGALADGLVIEINPAFERMFGFTREEALGRTSRQLGIWARYEDRLRLREQLAVDGFVKEMEAVGRRKSGEEFDCSLSTTALYLQGRHCVIGIARDISERKRVETALRASEEQYRLLFEHMLAGLIVFDVILDADGKPVDYRFVTGNPAYERMTGHRVAQDRGKTRREWSIGWPPEVEQKLFEVAMSGVPIEYERLNDSLGRWYDTRVFSPRPVQFALVFTDVTERKTAEAAVKRAQESFRELSVQLMTAQEGERARVAGELHDDFSQRLALLAVNLHLLRQRFGTEATGLQEAVNELYLQVQALAKDMRRMSHDLHPARLQQLGLVSAVRGLCEELSAAHGLPIAFESRDVPRDMPEVLALCLYRVVQEALRNVIRHSGAPSAAVALIESHGELQLTVTDNGRGFDVAAAQRKRSIGLASMRERVQAIAGRFSVESGTGRGTRIEVRAPLDLPGSGTGEPPAAA